MVLLFLYLSVNCRAAMQKIRNKKLAQNSSNKLTVLITRTYQCDLHAKYNNIESFINDVRICMHISKYLLLNF